MSPLHSPDLAVLPPTVVATTEHDQLCDEGDAFASALRAAQVPVLHRQEPGLVHDFLTLGELTPRPQPPATASPTTPGELLGRRR